VTPAAYACAGDHCITCADEGVSMTVLDIDGGAGLARCATQEGALHTIEIGLIEDPMPGTEVLVHASVAIAALESDPARAAAASAALDPDPDRVATSTRATALAPERAR
jgi:hydrogenase maturation factor